MPHYRTLTEVLDAHPEVVELHAAMRSATFASPFDEAAHKAARAAFWDRLKALDVTFGRGGLPGFGFPRVDVPDPDHDSLSYRDAARLDGSVAEFEAWIDDDGGDLVHGQAI